jgi:hypothetical protein
MDKPELSALVGATVNPAVPHIDAFRDEALFLTPPATEICAAILETARQLADVFISGAQEIQDVERMFGVTPEESRK